DGRAGTEQRRVGVVGDVEGQRLAALVSRAGADARGPTVHRLRPGVFQHGLVRALGEGGRVVHGGDVDGEGLRRTGVGAPVGRAAVVLEGDGDGGGAVGIGHGRVGEVAGAVDGRAGTEQRRVGVVGDVEGQRLAALVSRPRADARGPTIHRLRPGVFQHGLIRALGEGGRVVHGGDVDGEGL